MTGKPGAFRALYAAEALVAAERYPEAVELLRPLAAADPENAAVQHALGLSLYRAGQLEAGLAALTIAVGKLPWSADFLHDLAVATYLAGHWAEAEPLFRRAVATAPDPTFRYHLGTNQLGLGRFADGWANYESRKVLPHWAPDRLQQPGEWDGEPIEGRRMMIWPEQGWGDQIQFCRFAKDLAARGADVTLVAPPPLYTLFAELPVRVIPKPAGTILPAFDHWIHPLSIPLCLGLELQDLRGEAYLRAPVSSRERWAGKAPPGTIGYVWRGRPGHPNDAHRSLPSPEALVAVLNRAGRTHADLSDPVGDFADMAAVIEQLDLVIAVDTAVAHLAGALGKPCWLLIPAYAQDWRWMQDRADCPWYDAVRIFRQPAIGDWASVYAAVAEALDETGRAG